MQVRIETLTGTEVRRFLLQDEEQRLPLPADVQSVLVNEGGHGFYRVAYEPDLLERLLDRLHRSPGSKGDSSRTALAGIERYNLVNDAWAAVLAGLMPIADYLDLTARLRGEHDRNVWSVLLGSFTTLARIVEEEDRPGLQKLVRDRLGPAVVELGWQPRFGEDELTGQLRGDLLRAMGTLGDDPTTQMFAARVYTAGVADASVLASAITIVAHTGDSSRYEDFLARFRARGHRRKNSASCSPSPTSAPRRSSSATLALTIDGTVRTQDGPLLLRLAADGNPQPGPRLDVLSGEMGTDGQPVSRPGHPPAL